MRSTQPKDLPGDGSAEAVRQYYDRFAEQEEDRLTKDIPGRVSFDIHRRFLTRHIKPGWRVLEVGAGPGTFTVVLASLGAQIVVTDLSPVQLGLNAEFVAAADLESAVERREVADIRDLSAYPDGSFDAVVAYGGPLSYAFEQERQAMAELVRVVRPRGLVLASVMSLWGTWRARLPGVTDLEVQHGTIVGDQVLRTGDLRHVPGIEHVCRMFTWGETVALVAEAGTSMIDGSASNWASLHDLDFLASLEANPSRWQQFLDREATACAAEGARDGGTHILFAAERGA
jgi:SAM-dependent methyltransferase